MNKKLIINKIAMMASDKIHYKYILNQTKEKYILIDELLENCFEAVRVSKLIFKKESNEYKQIEVFENILRNNSDKFNTDILSNNEIIKSIYWNNIKNAANDILTSFKIDLLKWEKENE